MAEMLGELTVNVAADFRARLVSVDNEPVGFHDGRRWLQADRWLRVLSNRMLGAGATRQKTEAKDADNRDDQKWFRVHGGNSKPD
jgi:hypothetical protein